MRCSAGAARPLRALPARAGESSGWRRMPAVAGDAMVATSHPLATRAGLRALERGRERRGCRARGRGRPDGRGAGATTGSAATRSRSSGTDGRAARHQRLGPLAGGARRPGGGRASGPQSVTVPGAVRLWADLAERFGTARPRRARSARQPMLRADGVACTARVADKWARAALAPWPAPAAGRALRAARARRAPCGGSRPKGPDALYEGEVAAAIAACNLALRGRSRARTARSGSSRCAAPIAGSRSASCRRTGRASRHCSRSRSTTASSRGCTRRSRR